MLPCLSNIHVVFVVVASRLLLFTASEHQRKQRVTRWLLYLLLFLMLQRQSDQFVVSVSRFLWRVTLKDVTLQLRHIRARRITLVASQVVRFHNLFRPGIVPSSGHRHRFEEIDKKVVVRKSVPMLFGR